jgi:hypothetical protein
MAVQSRPAQIESPYPDLVIGAVIGLVVLNGARRILALV